MKKFIKLPLILLSILIISTFTTSCGISSIFGFRNNLNPVETTEIESEIITEIESEETTTQETTTVATEPEQTVGLINSENIEVEDDPTPATTISEAPTVTDISNPVEYSVEEANTAASIVASLNPSDAFSAVKSFHDWIISHTFYTVDLTYNTADGVFSHGQSACLGYSLAFEALMDEWSALHPEAGVDTKVAYGDDDTRTPKIGHAWNMVKISGNWYHLDATWDDNGSTSIYDYFLVPDSVISQSRVTYFVDNFESVPVATSTSYVFYMKIQGVPTTTTLANLSDFSNQYLTLINSGKTSVTFFYPSIEDINNIVISYDVWLALSRAGYSSVNISYNLSNLYSNESYSNYYYFTIVPQI